MNGATETRDLKLGTGKLNFQYGSSCHGVCMD